MSRRMRRALLSAVGILTHLSGLNHTLRLRRRRASDYRVFILEYHSVCADRDEREGVVSAARLRRHVEYLAQRYRIVPLSVAARALTSEQTLSADYLVVTFDDGYADNFQEAWPILREAGIPATIFITTGFIDHGYLWFDFARRSLHAFRSLDHPLPRAVRGALRGCSNVEEQVDRLKRLPPTERDRLLHQLRERALTLDSAVEAMSWDQIREVHKSGGEIGCHTVTHPVLSTLNHTEQKREIITSRDRIADELGHTPTLFAYPNGAQGDFTSQTVDILRSSGFEASCTTVRGPNGPDSDPMRLRRIGVGADSISALSLRLSGLLEATGVT